MCDSGEMTGSNQFTTEMLYMYIMLHTYIYICNTLDPNRSPCQKCSVDPWYTSAGISGSQKGAQEMLHLGVHTREPGFSSARLLRGERLGSRLREKGEHQQLFLAVPKDSNGAEGKEDIAAHPSSQQHVPAPGGLRRQKGFSRVASSPLAMA